jgi:hypothetical protein
MDRSASSIQIRTSSITSAAVGGKILNEEREPTVINELTHGVPGH